LVQRTCIPSRGYGGKWPYDHVFQHNVTNAELSGKEHRACVQVSIKKLTPLYDDDDLHLERPVLAAPSLKLKEVVAWTRLVIWENLDNGRRASHVNVASDLRRLLPALVQDFTDGPGPCAYISDYDLDRLEFGPGKNPWPHPIQIPAELVSLVSTGAP